ncbi:Fcf2 pre-rRNA processing-domain-containing protein [Lentinula raphanica]|uniref:Fcf2 pre-rRNA processing-domain-containing protein n=1 Tax=Lentinula raphanica TaxID=153919 RepID=A0AA38PJW9_9AGAR|nr:Fcf2 pre-rRNA processing-domain-containing protein [Lentinula raphanica]KAJ3824263.1 Fcf2 pre-rRNA processing-domain-containing protein [Lentinula raphanica]KAJ3844076.1 Fcf2 pre-rRNA processing-domain-containing protein [Lentinula raphanica]KAJ3972384.1 Fcf2 pre-rRNA processing-domain-containing protein [Lentinula raphanica]
MSVKGKERAETIEESSDSDSDEHYDSSSSSSEDEESIITQEYLDSLLEKARKNADLLEEKEKAAREAQQDKEDVLVLEKEDSQPALPALDPGKLPPSYFTFSSTSFFRAETNKSNNGNTSQPSSASPNSLSRNPIVESAESALAKAASSSALPLPTFHTEKALTKKQKKELKNRTAGPDWFDLPAPSESDLPRLYREVEALRLRNQLDPKRFYRKEEGEGKGIKGLPRHFAIGKIITTDTPFGGASGDNLTRAERKRTLVDELVDDAEMKRYAKRKFEDLQKVRGARGKNTKNARKRKPKW